MKNNKHPHYDLIVELISDLAKKAVMVTGSNSIVNVEIHNVASDIKGLYTFKIKPREFIKGHWYPCVDPEGDSCLYFYNDGFKICGEHNYSSTVLKREDMKWIGESLGEIKFGDEL